jgi:hypothetical protein
MNIADNTAIKLDAAISQRFVHLRMEPQWTQEYMAKVAKGNTEAYSWLYMIAKKMNEINDTIRNDKSLGEDYIIGTRDITIEKEGDITIDDIRQAVLNNLIPSLENVGRRGYITSKQDIADAVIELREMVNG